MMKNKSIIYIGIAGILIVSTIFLISKGKNISDYSVLDRLPAIEPEYSGIVIPPNISPINFNINEEGTKYFVRISSYKGKEIRIQKNKNKLIIPSKKWSRLLKANKGNKLNIEIYVKKASSGWVKYKSIENKIAEEETDPYLVYRLIPPGFTLWEDMGLYQRELNSFNEKEIIHNRSTDGNCMNCHAFNKNDGETMMFHMRASHGGTIIQKDGKAKKFNTATDSTLSAGVYPAWHPDGDLITFSVNKISQSFYAHPKRRIEVIDRASDLILYDIKENSVSPIKQASTKESLETFPAWSPKGDYLYYCSAHHDTSLHFEKSNEYAQVRYDLVRIAFNAKDKSFGKTDTLISSRKTGRSVSFPRISPNGRYILFSYSTFGNFSIWHDESDLYVYDLETEKIIKADALNSEESESYHSWSSNGKWVVFSSRRVNGLYTMPYFSYHYGEGKFSKPFLLPQRDPDYYKTFTKSFNIPELIKTPVNITGGKLVKVARGTTFSAPGPS